MYGMIIFYHHLAKNSGKEGYAVGPPQDASFCEIFRREGREAAPRQRDIVFLDLLINYFKCTFRTEIFALFTQNAKVMIYLRQREYSFLRYCSPRTDSNSRTSMVLRAYVLVHDHYHFDQLSMTDAI